MDMYRSWLGKESRLQLIPITIPEKIFEEFISVVLYGGKENNDKNSHSLLKHAYSNILKILPPKNENFQIKKKKP